MKASLYFLLVSSASVKKADALLIANLYVWPISFYLSHNFAVYFLASRLDGCSLLSSSPFYSGELKKKNHHFSNV